MSDDTQAGEGRRDIADGWFVEPPAMDELCVHCGPAVPVVDEFDDVDGFEEQARPFHVVVLLCGHEIVTPISGQVSS